MQLYAAALAQVFGQGGRRPLRAAVIRLGIMGVLAVGCGHLLAAGLRGLQLTPLDYSYRLFFLAAVAVQVAVGVVLFAAIGITSTSHDTLARFLYTLPVKRMHRWLVLQLPAIVLSVLAVLLVFEPFAILFGQLGLNLGMVVLAALIGVGSALGCALGLPNIPLSVRVGGVAALVWAEYSLLRHMLYAPSVSLQLAGLVGLFITTSGLLVWSMSQKGLPTTHTSKQLNVHGQSLPVVTWLGKKVVRTATTRLSLMATFGLSLGLSIAARNNPGFDSSALGFFGAFLAGSFASDIRSTARPALPPEIAGLRGTLSFVLHEAFTVVPLGFMAVSPLLYLAITHGGGLGTVCIQILMGQMAGLLASTLVAPQPRDIMGQFLASIVCIVLLVGLPQLPGMRSLEGSGMVITLAAVCILLLAGACIVEYKRNAFVWRKNRVKQTA